MNKVTTSDLISRRMSFRSMGLRGRVELCEPVASRQDERSAIRGPDLSLHFAPLMRATAISVAALSTPFVMPGLVPGIH